MRAFVEDEGGVRKRGDVTGSYLINVSGGRRVGRIAYVLPTSQK